MLVSQFDAHSISSMESGADQEQVFQVSPVHDGGVIVIKARTYFRGDFVGLFLHRRQGRVLQEQREN